jgi:nucleotide-binding universal stress UspA family protein
VYKRMLVPLNGSELAEVALPYAKELAGRLDLELILLHVCEQHKIES